MLKLGYSGFKHLERKELPQKDLKPKDAIMSGIMFRAGEENLHYLVQYDGYRKITIYVTKGEYEGHYEFSYNVMPQHVELLNAVYMIEADMAIFF